MILLYCMLIFDVHHIHLASFEFFVLNSPKLCILIHYLGEFTVLKVLHSHLLILIFQSKFTYLVFKLYSFDLLLHALEVPVVLSLHLELLLLDQLQITVR